MAQCFAVVAYLHTLEQEMVASQGQGHNGSMPVLLMLAEHTVKLHAALGVAGEERIQSVVTGRKDWVQMGMHSTEEATSP